MCLHAYIAVVRLLLLLLQELQTASLPEHLALTRVLGLNSDEAVHVVCIHGAVAVVDLRARQALARDAAGERLLQVSRAHDLGHGVLVAVHLTIWGGVLDTEADSAFNFLQGATYVTSSTEVKYSPCIRPLCGLMSLE